MAEPAAAPVDLETRRNRRHFLLRRLHALTGIVPVGLFLVEHLITNARAIQGQTCFNHAVDWIIQLPFLPLIEIFGIFIPLAFHALYGVKLAFSSKQNVGQYGFSANWMFLLQRLTGMITLVFIIFHLKDFRVAKLLGQMDHTAFFFELDNQLANKGKALFYILGVTAAVFHFANGLRTFLFSWGLTISKRSQRYTAYAVAALGVALWFLGANTVLFFATGHSTFVPSSMMRGEGNRDMCDETLVPKPVQKTAAQPAAAAQPPR
jgi:succinate dehydrogenase/fumarate reductase cytochrome b subunit (b558 family)